MEVEPEQVMRRVLEGAQMLPDDPPELLRNPPGTGHPLEPVQHTDALGAVHRHWAEVHAAEQGRPTEPGSGVRARVRARVTTADAPGALRSQQANRFLIGDLIRAVDTLAKRVDEIGDRLQLLEAIVDEVVVVTGKEFTAVRATLLARFADKPSRGDGA